MKFYTQQHPHYCGIDLHARTMYLCILNQEGVIVLHRNMKTEPEAVGLKTPSLGRSSHEETVAVFQLTTVVHGDLIAPKNITFRHQAARVLQRQSSAAMFRGNNDKDFCVRSFAARFCLIHAFCFRTGQ